MDAGVSSRALWWFSLTVILVLGLWIATRVLRPRRLRPRVADDIMVAMARVRANRRRLRQRAATQHKPALVRWRHRRVIARRR
jgi:hypothetical protein